ncbi:peptidoglycan DD-metalloendopeptidase family protein [Kamptonema cortianum]|nr:peptidoglycan DD-metalloendopeptidase family protein [Kamptonema cortianum]
MSKFLFLFSLFFVSPVIAQDPVAEIKALNKEKIELLEKKRQLLEEASVLEKTLQDFTIKQIQTNESISQQRKQIEAKLPLLLRLGRVNPLKLLVDTAAGKDTIRGIILMRSLSHSLKQELQRLQATSSEISALSKELEVKKKVQAQLLDSLQIQQTQLEAFEKVKFEELTKAELEKLSKEEDINFLLNEAHATLSKKAQSASKASAKQDLPFRWLEQPVAGKVVIDKELQKKFSPGAQGIIFETKKNAEVFAPSEGTIVFKGPFKNQGDILIIEAGEKVYTVLMGMHKINAEVGESVYAGQKIGSMAGYGASSPKLYLELRQKGKAIDPKGYFAQ